MPRGRYQQQQWDAREQAILDALARLSAERGFAAVTMDDLADAVGISKATLYQHFASKDALLAHLMRTHTRQFQQWLESSAGQPPVDRLCGIMRHLMSGHITPLRGLIQVGREEVLPVFEMDADLVTAHAQTLDQLCAIVRQGQAEGQIAPDLAPGVVISAMWALSNVSPGRHGPIGDLPPAEDIVQQMVTLFERAIRP